jgi:shikimate kinase
VNIVLIGYRGTGKSSVGKILASKTGMPLVSTDEQIVRKAGRSIPEIVEKQGWEHFRDIETDVVEEWAGRDGLILDCGGGVILRDRNRDLLRRKGFVVWLTAAIPTILERISGDTQRPSLTSGKSFTDEVAEVLAVRTPLYRNTAHQAVSTDDGTPEKVAERILRTFAEFSIQDSGDGSGSPPRN